MLSAHLLPCKLHGSESYARIRVHHDILTGPYRWSREEPSVPHRVEVARGSNHNSGAGGLYCETGSHYFGLISSSETSGGRRSRTHVPLSCRKRETSLSEQQSIAKVQSLSELGHYSYECSATRLASKNAERSDRPFVEKNNGRGSDAVGKPQQRSGSSKNDRGQ